MHVDFYFHKSRIFSQKNLPKKFDHTNRLKALHDTLSRILQFDDSYLFSVSADKSIIDDSKPESLRIFLGPVKVNNIYIDLESSL